MKGSHAILGLWTLLALSACESLPNLPDEVCGNGVIEVGEDCDKAAVAGFACDESCRVPCRDDLSCPPGWGCGVDDLCRQPAGELEAIGAPSGLTAETLIPADFDGDRRTDLLAIDGLRVSAAYLDVNGLLPDSADLAVQSVEDAPNLPAAGDLDGDGRADVVLRTRDGLSVLRGRADRVFGSEQFARTASSYFGLGTMRCTRLVQSYLDPRSSAGNNQLLAVCSDGLYLINDRHPSLVGRMPLRLFAWTETEEVPFVVTSRLQELSAPSGGQQLEEVIIAMPGASEVTVFQSGHFDSNSVFQLNEPPYTGINAVAPFTVSLPAGYAVSGPALPVATLGSRRNDLLWVPASTWRGSARGRIPSMAPSTVT